MKTPEQIAEETAREFADIEWTASSLTGPEKASAYNTTLSTVRLAVLAAITKDRAQRDPNEDGSLHGAVILALRDRGEHGGEFADAVLRAADWVEDEPDEFWDQFGGRMLDELEYRFGGCGE